MRGQRAPARPAQTEWGHDLRQPPHVGASKEQERRAKRAALEERAKLVTDENNKFAELLRELIASPGWKDGFGPLLVGEVERWTEADDLMPGEPTEAFKRFAGRLGLTHAEMHWMLVGLMRGLHLALGLPEQWLAGYAGAQEALEEVQKSSLETALDVRNRLVLPAGMRTDPVPPGAYGPMRPEGGEVS